MLNSVFRFKEFAVAQDRCAMKVNTDGVLLGAWAGGGTAATILDIGTGSGVIALMMAQRYPNAMIDAIDIDAGAFWQARDNFLSSRWHGRLYAHHSALQDYGPHSKYDLIISNPPYFVADFRTGDQRRDIAKHSLSLSYSELLSVIDSLLAEAGDAFLVLPVFNLPLVESIALENRLYICAQTEVIAVEGKPPYLVLIKLGRQQAECSKSSLVIQNQDGAFTKEYKELTKDFYLKF